MYKRQILYRSADSLLYLCVAALRRNQALQLLGSEHFCASVQDAIDNSFNVVRTRIDKFGVVQPNIQKLEGQQGRIMVEIDVYKRQISY